MIFLGNSTYSWYAFKALNNAIFSSLLSMRTLTYKTKIFLSRIRDNWSFCQPFKVDVVQHDKCLRLKFRAKKFFFQLFYLLFEFFCMFVDCKEVFLLKTSFHFRRKLENFPKTLGKLRFFFSQAWKTTGVPSINTCDRHG